MMATKRTAEKELTDRNWDEDDEPEDPGIFKQAASDVLQNRVVRKAKRRGLSSEEGNQGGAFKSFAGFGGFGAKSADSAPSFNFGTSTNKPIGGLSNGSPQEAKKATGFFSHPKAKPDSDASEETTKTVKTNGTEDSKSIRSQFLAQLQALNKSVSKWISDHVEKDACVILSPIFKDYEKHLENIKKKYPTEIPYEGSQKNAKKDLESEKNSSASKDTSTTESSSLPKANSPPDTSTQATTKPTSTFSFGSVSSAASSTPFTFGSGSVGSGATGFSFKSSVTSSSTESSGFSFKPSASGFGDSEKKPFTFAVSSTPSTSSTDPPAQNTTAQDEEKYEPPKAEVSEVKEEDSTYSKRCKLFFKKDSSWTEKGVGNLHLKPLDDGKMQLLIRADTNLGNILLNIKVGSSLPVNRQGKNNVSVFCVPNPPLSTKEEDAGKPTSMLIRVKTSEDADELFQKLEEAKKD